MTTTQPGDWTTRAPRSLTDLTCPEGDVIDETQDRRWLWRLTVDIGGRVEGNRQRQLRHDLERYLADTCTHHWHDRTTDEPGTRWQCLWCHRVEDGDYPAEVPPMTTTTRNEPLPQTVDQVAAVVHSHDCGCPPDHDDHEEHLRQNGVWVATVLGCAYRVGYRLVTDPQWVDPETAIREQHHCTDECGYDVRHDLAGHSWYDVDPPSDEHAAAVAALAQAMRETGGAPAEVGRWLAEHDWRLAADRAKS